MKKLLTALLVVASMGISGSVCAQDFDKRLKAYDAEDYATALKWRFLAERGDAAAQFNLALIYERGQGVVQDDKEVVAWLRKAAEQAHALAQHNLGAKYELGRGVVQDYKEAVAWYRKAAEQGIDGAQYSLGVMYREGRGVIQYNVYAHMWFNILSSNGNQADHVNFSASRDEIAEKMTAADISKAQELARECVKKQYKDC